MTIKRLFERICDLSEAHTPGFGVYSPMTSSVTRGKNGPTKITLVVYVGDDFTPNDCLEGLQAYLVLGRTKEVKDLIASEAA